MAADALIFDLDGTVWDSARWFARALANGDLRLEEHYRAELAGTGNIVRILERENIRRERLVQRATDLGGPPPLFPGIADALVELQRRGTPLGVATSLPGSIAVPMLRAVGLDQTFAVTIHAGLCRSPKPNPASINMALGALRLRPSESVFYVGDRASDAEAARRAGVSFAWVTHGCEAPADDPGVVSVCSEELLQL